MIEVIPAILPESLEDLKAHLLRVRGLVKRVQIDIVDGVFAPSRTWPYTAGGHDELARLADRSDGLPLWQEFDFELDMMVRNPEVVVDVWLHAGVGSVIVHIGSTNAPSAVFEKVRSADALVGIAIRPLTPAEEYEPLIGEIDFIQFMGSDRVGLSGVSLDPSVPERVAAFHARHPSVIIGVDIGVNEETAPALVAAGARRLAIGSAIFNAEN